MGDASQRAREAVERFGQPGAGGLTAAELVHVLDVMGVVSSPEHATETMRRALVMQGEDTVVDEDTVYSAQQLDEMAAFLRAPLPGQAAYRASQGRRGAPPPRQAAGPPIATSAGPGTIMGASAMGGPPSTALAPTGTALAPTGTVLAPASASGGASPGGAPPEGASVAARLKWEFDQHKLHLQEGIEKRKSPEYLQERMQATAAAGDRQTIGGAAVVARSERSVLRSALKWAVLLLFLRLAWLLAGRRPELRNLLSRLPRMPKLRLPGLRRGGGGAS